MDWREEGWKVIRAIPQKVMRSELLAILWRVGRKRDMKNV